ncbi:MAG TPA: phosphatidylglycerophosphatase A [Rhodanobacteraceae bacterium]|nr:phosphatidylglycerophosphatase A [Rhodanobacteraceae bacterium]
MRFDRDQRRAILAHPAGWIASGFGAGFSPFAPGTAGSALALLPYLALRELPVAWYLVLVALAFVLGVWVSAIVVRRLGISDPGVIVWDEFVGQWITLAFAPHDWGWIVAGFFLFRFFDVWKPWPVSWADRALKGGLGVMLDDVGSGIYAAVALGILVYFF